MNAAALFFLFVLATLGSYRIWRFVAEDHFPPMVWVRDRFEAAMARRFGPDWAGGIRCPFCSGWWACVAVWAVLWFLYPLPLPGAWPWAMSALVGLIAQRDDA